MSKFASRVIHAVVGWAICGATIGIGRQLFPLKAALLMHAAVAPFAFGLLAWHYFNRFPLSSASVTAGTMFAVVVGLDAVVVAPLFEHSYAMFHSTFGTWLPIASIFLVTYGVGRTVRRRANSQQLNGR